MKSPKTKLSRYLIPAVFLLSIVIAVMLMLSRPQAKTADAREVARVIDTLAVQTGTHSPTIPVFVRVTTPNHASLRASVTADVAKLLALKGAIVETGETVIELDDREAVLAVKQRQADLQETQSQIDAEKLSHENRLYVIRNDKGERAKHNREQIIKSHKIRLRGLDAKQLRAQSALELARLDLQRTKISAPFAARVTQLHVSVGDRVRPGDKLIDLYERQAIELTGPIPSRYIPILQTALDQQQTLLGKGYINGQPFEAQLVRLGGEVNSGTGGVDAIFKLNTESSIVQLGRSIKLEVTLPPTEDTFIVPNTALYGVDTIYKVEQQRLKATPVIRLGDYPGSDNIAYSLVASSEINSGDILMTTQLPNAVENLLVKPASADP